ncbi:hypothetical protein ACLB2K_076111 [Fragaria x ananassa]
MTTLFLLTNLFQSTVIANASSNETDRFALLNLKESIVSDPQGLLNSWNESIHFCKWQGINCSRRHQRVTALNLTAAELHGTISPYIGNLSFLRFINLGSNNFSGKIPQQVDHLFRLQYLNLSANMLEGGIPLNLTFCPEPRVLSIGQNRLTGKIPSEIVSLMKLVHLNVDRNNLTGGIPPFLGNLSSIGRLSLGGNPLGGTVPEEIGRLRNLWFFSINSGNLTGMIPRSLFNMSSLEVISYTFNEFKGSIPPDIGLNMPNLQEVYLAGNDFSGEIPASFSNASQLKKFDIWDNMFVGDVPTSFGNLPILHWLNLGFNHQGSNSYNDLDFITSLTNCSSLKMLSLSVNKFGGIIPASFGKLQKLQLLSLSANRLSGRIPSSLGNLTQLFELSVSQNALEGSIPPNIGNCQLLQEMDLSDNKLSGDIPSQVIGLSTLNNLNWSHNSLTGSLPVEVGNLLQGMIPSSLASLKGLQILDLSGNKLSSQIPKDMQRLRFMIYLNLSFNNLEGVVPQEGVFQNISAISLDGNTKLCGGVPELQLPPCTIKVPKQRKLQGFKLKLTISIVAGCSVLFALMLAVYWRRKTQKTKPVSEVASNNSFSKVSYQTLHQATGGFSSSNQIGSGGFSSVYKGVIDELENNAVAIKVLNLQQKGASKSFVAECNALRSIRHRNLVKILTCCSSTDSNGNDFKALVFEYMSNGSLEEWMHRENQSRRLNLLQNLNIAFDVASAVCYLHDHCEPQIIHRDLKPSNVLLDDEMVARVSDFGLARLIPTTADSSENQSSTVGIKGTIGYAAPEYAVGVEPSAQGDVYSYGILVLQLFTGRRPTDEMFVDGFNIHTFVKTGIQGRLMEIVDPTLITTLEEETAISTTNNDIETDGGNIDNQNLNRMDSYVGKCILPTLKIGLACSEESPRNRISMEEVLKELHHVKIAYTAIGADIRRERPTRS